MMPAIREGRPEDIAACARIYERALPMAFPRLAPIGAGEREFADSIAGEELWVAENEGRIAGLITIWRPDAFIHHLYIVPAWQRRGLGRALLAFALRRCGGHAALKCNEANRPAHAFYQAAGWRPAGWGWSAHGAWIRFRY
jgi:GNAT superfamily N-acetyltransferase